MSSDLPPHVQAEVRRILDAAARRLLRERLATDAPNVTEGPRRPAIRRRCSRRVAHSRDSAGLSRRRRKRDPARRAKSA